MAKILVAEDSQVDQMLVTRLLEDPDWTIELATDGLEALGLVEKFEPDLIVTDMQMPNMGGLELVQQLRLRNASIPIVLITGQGSEDSAFEALRCGATSYSPKSQLARDLKRTVSHCLEIAQRMQYTHDTRLIPKPKTQTFVLENELSLIGPTIENLQNSLPSWSDSDRLQIGMAIDEAVVNAMHHGNLEVESRLREDDEKHYYSAIEDRKSKHPFCTRRVRIEAEFSDKHICVQISDEGPGFNPSQIVDPRKPENLQKVSGRGLLLIKNFMDQVSHNQTGNQITMTKLRRTS
jgi:CheY-like chemotaxis protein